MHDFFLEIPTPSYTFLFAFFKPAPFIMTFTGLGIAGHEQFSQRIFLEVFKKYETALAMHFTSYE